MYMQSRIYEVILLFYLIVKTSII